MTLGLLGSREVDVSTVAPVLVSLRRDRAPLARSCLELVQGIDELLASGGYAINLDLMATVGANMTVERMREILNGIAVESGAYCRFCMALSNWSTGDLET